MNTLSPKERHELSCYLTKLKLQNDPDYWNTIRERTNSDQAQRYVPVPANKDTANQSEIEARRLRIKAVVGVWEDRYQAKSTDEIMKELRTDLG